jgi:UPF0271 protein
VSVELERFGDTALRAAIAAGSDTRAIARSLRMVPGVIDVVVTERYALVTFDPSAPPTALRQAFARALAEPLRSDAPREHRVDVCYDGPDLDDVARLTALPREEVISLHASASYVVAAIGFLPGFGYLRGLDPRLSVPRRPSPRTRVPALSVGVAGPYTGVYPFDSPGGWNLLGTAVGFAPFTLQRGAALAVGDRVRFVRVQS